MSSQNTKQVKTSQPKWKQKHHVWFPVQKNVINPCTICIWCKICTWQQTALDLVVPVFWCRAVSMKWKLGVLHLCYISSQLHFVLFWVTFFMVWTQQTKASHRGSLKTTTTSAHRDTSLCTSVWTPYTVQFPAAGAPLAPHMQWASQAAIRLMSTPGATHCDTCHCTSVWTPHSVQFSAVRTTAASHRDITHSHWAPHHHKISTLWYLSHHLCMNSPLSPVLRSESCAGAPPLPLWSPSHIGCLLCVPQPGHQFLLTLRITGAIRLLTTTRSPQYLSPHCDTCHCTSVWTPNSVQRPTAWASAPSHSEHHRQRSEPPLLSPCHSGYCDSGPAHSASNWGPAPSGWAASQPWLLHSD